MNEPHRPYDSVIMQNMSQNAADNVHYLNILFWPSTLKGREKWIHFFGPVNGKTKVCKDPPSGSFWQKTHKGWTAAGQLSWALTPILTRRLETSGTPVNFMRNSRGENGGCDAAKGS